MKKVATLSIVTALLGLAFSVFIGFYSRSILEGVFAGAIVLIIALLVDVRLRLESQASLEQSLLFSYTRLLYSKCELFREAAHSKLREMNAYFEDLVGGQIVLDSLPEVYGYLEILFTQLKAVRMIFATSFGEFDEWRDLDSWWARQYVELHRQASRRGVKIQRIFILRADQDAAGVSDVFRANIQVKVGVKHVFKRGVTIEDFKSAANCIIFSGKNGDPLYAIQAVHDQDGKFSKAVIYNDSEHVEALVAACHRIESVATEVR